MKLFIDSADLTEITKCLDTDLIDGITTNPTLMKKGGNPPSYVYRQLEMLGVKDISMEVTGDYDEMTKQALELTAQFGDVATINIPMTVDGLKVCKYLSDLDIRTNVTLIFNAAQALLAAKSGATYVSPFVGRIDDEGYAGTEVVRSCAELLRGTSTQVLAASIRTTQRVVRCFYSGADIVTMPPSVFWAMYKHTLTDKGLAIFEQDVKDIK